MMYKALDPQKREIRLVVIQAGNRDEEIVCQLETVSLDHEPGHSALSYVWGATEPQCFIRLDGVRFEAGPNLAQALNYLQ